MVDAEHSSAVLLHEHHLLAWAMQRLPLLDAALQGALAPEPLLTGPDLLKVEQQRLGLKLRCLLQHRNQHAVPHLHKWISSGAPTAAALRLVLGLMVSSIDALGTTHRHTNCISGDLLAEALGTFGHVPLLDS